MFVYKLEVCLAMGREFDQLFDEWALTYDDTVDGKDEQYKEVFYKYDQILSTVAAKAKGTVVEFGVGTGNLTKKLIEQGHDVIGIEPSKEMRAIAKQKIPSLIVFDGDFLLFPNLEKPIQSIVSSYAFHHLKDKEKEKGLELYASLLQSGDKIVFADTMFENEEARENIINWAKEKNYNRLIEDLQTEYYTFIPIFEHMLMKNDFTVTFQQMNKFVWILEAIKN